MKVTYDKTVGCIYIALKRIKKGEVVKTKEVAAHVFLDFDNRERIIGIEVTDASLVPKSVLKGATIYE